MDKILIVGYGITGYNMHNELLGLSPDLYDINKKIKLPTRQHSEYDFIFICVDTPYIDTDNPCDITQVKNAINKWKPHLTEGGTFVIKSTVLPSLIDTLSELNAPIVYSPEYYGNTQHCNNFEFNFTILGGEDSYPYKVQQLLQKVKDARHTFRFVDAKTACLAKYMENCYLAMKVSFCSQFFDIANENGVNYEDLRELFILDPRVNPSHTFVYKDKPYWDSHCLTKDVRAIAETQNAELLKNIINFNNKRKINN
jgi:UDP-glucose 6-dehydrogenase